MKHKTSLFEGAIWGSRFLWRFKEVLMRFSLYKSRTELQNFKYSKRIAFAEKHMREYEE
jgi:hypothetical protein